MKSLLGGYRSSVVDGKLILTDSIVQNVINIYLHDTRKEQYLKDTNVKQKIKINKVEGMFLQPQSSDLDESPFLCDILEKTEESMLLSENNSDILENKNEIDEEEDEQEVYDIDDVKMEDEEESETSSAEEVIL